MPDILANHFEIIPATADALPWICDTFTRQLEWMGEAGPRHPSSHARALSRIVRSGTGRAAVAVPIGYPSEYAGWAIEHAGRILFVYVRDQFRRNGIGCKLLTTLTDSAPFQVAYWTPSCIEMELHGFPLQHDIKAYQTIVSFTRRSDERVTNGNSANG